MDAFARYVQEVFVQTGAISALQENRPWMLIHVDWFSIWWVCKEMFSKSLFVWSWVRFDAFLSEFVFNIGACLDEGAVYVGDASLEVVVFGLVLVPLVVVLFACGFTANLLLM